MYEELANAKILVDANALIAGFVHSGLLDKAKCGEVLELIRRCSAIQKDWIPVSGRLPENLEPVNITWINHNPESYYIDIKDKPFTATGVYFNGQWYWWSATCTDYLREYGSNEVDKVDDAIEIIAWMPLSEPYMAESEDNNDNPREDQESY